MLLVSVILVALATVALDIGVFYYLVDMIFSCSHQYCSPLAGYAEVFLGTATTTLGPGLVLTVAATFCALFALRRASQSQSRFMLVAIPVVAVIFAALMTAGSGSLLPFAATAYARYDPTFATLVSPDWVGAATWAALPLAFWPIASFFVLLPHLLRRGDSVSAARDDSNSA